ncbi:MAG TPA: hypothetical protein VFS43_42995 [Polyangiaceae bacterium]|nr:hypothetical protein [Polyangiaceae bacterium]
MRRCFRLAARADARDSAPRPDRSAWALAPLLFALAFVVACGGSPRARKPAAPPAPPPAPLGLDDVAAEPVESPATAGPPSDLVIAFSAQSPDTLLRLAKEAAGSSTPYLANVSIELLYQLALGPELAELVDAKAPLDAALLGEGTDGDDLETVLAVGVVPNFAAAAAARLQVDRRPNGALSVRAKGDRPLGRLAGMCELWPAAGAVPARLVCGQEPRLVGRLGPYLARELASEPRGGGVRFRIGPVLRDEMVEPKRRGQGDDAEAFGRQLVAALFDDIDGFSIDAGLDPASARFTFTAHFRGKGGALGAFLTGDPSRAGPPPRELAELPADTGAALFAAGLSAEGAARAGEGTLRSLEAMMRSDDELPPEARERAMAALKGVAFTGGPWLAAAGYDEGAALAAAKAKGGRAPARAALHGWQLYLFDEPAERWKGALRTLIAVDRLPGSAGLSTRKAPAPAPRPPTSKGAFAEARVTPAEGLPAGSAHFEYRVTPAPKPGEPDAAAERPYVDHVLVVPRGDKTWVAVAEDPALARAKVKIALSGPAKKRFGERPELADLRGGPVVWGGFITRRMMNAWSLPDEWPKKPAELRDDLLRLGDASDRSPVPFAARAVPEGQGLRLEVATRVARATLEVLVKQPNR